MLCELGKREEIYTPVSLRGVSWASPAYASHAAESSDCDRDRRGSRRVPPGASQETVPMAAGRAGDRGAAPASDGACRRSHGFPPGFCSGLACSSCGGAPAARSVPAVCVHGPPCRRGWAQTCPGTCVQKGLEEELQPTGRLKREVGTQPRSPDQAQWGAGVGQPHSCAPQPQTAQGSAASTPFLLPGAPSPHLPALQRDLSFHLLPVVGRIVSPPNNVLEFQLPGTCKWDLTQTEGLGRGNQVTMRTCQMMVALHPMTGGLVRGT